ncbi:hypothetical protein BC830DRAFT_1085740 [Chytriomyces sp. MP71]|nr:hypothetical protein BC830DRAFT_1085740 [Chytriomyces sp. MP71]
MSAFTLENPAFRNYAFATGLLGLKMVSLNVSIISIRVWNNNYSTPEDAIFPTIMNTVTFGKWSKTCDEKAGSYYIHRLNAALNHDVVHVPMLLVLGLTWVATCKPSQETSFRVFSQVVVARYGHALVYVAGLQPFRILTHLGGLAAAAEMAIGILLA